jgi:hypothetical protein
LLLLPHSWVILFPPFGFLAPKDFNIILSFQSFDYEPYLIKVFSRNASCVLISIFTFLIFTQQDERGIENHAAEILCIIPIPYSFEKRRCNTLLYKKKTRG